MIPLLVLGLTELVRGALIFSLIPLFGKEVGLSVGAIGAAISLLYLLDNLARLPSGWIIDRFGGKWLMAGGMVISGIGIALIYSHQNEGIFILGGALFGLGFAPIWPTVITGVAAKMPLSQLSEALSKVFVAWLVGTGIGVITINFLIARSFAVAFMLCAAVLIVAILFNVFGHFPYVQSKEIPQMSLYFKELWGEIKSLWMLYPGMFVQNMSVGILMPILAIYVTTVFNLPAEAFSYLFIGAGIFTVLLLIPAGKFADRFGVKWPLIFGFLVAAVCLALLPLQNKVIPAMAIGAVLGIAYSFILPAWNGLQARVVSPEKRGTMWAIFMTVEGMGTATGSFVGGKAWDMFSHQAPFFVSAIVLTAMAIFYAMGNIDRLLRRGQS